jgi:uncharacterized membrane protein YphA (DoxX/SURF4 family)
MKKILFHFSRVFVGIVFIFSGFVKAVDPMGTAIKFSDYFNYAFDLPAFTVLSLPLSLIMCAAELALGIMLIFNLQIKLSALGAALLMIFFTPLTLYLAIANPVSDCGCFGDAVKLTNWETFWKNIVIDFFLFFLFIWRKEFASKIKIKIQMIFTSIIILSTFGFEIYNYSYLPIIDFMPYKVGNNIPELMTTPPDAPKDIYENTFTYKNSITNETKEFNDENYPWDDSTWVFVDRKSKLIKKGYTPPIHDFTLINTNEEDITEEVLTSKDTVILVVVYSLDKVKLKLMQKTQKFTTEFSKNKTHTKIYCLTSSQSQTIIDFQNKNGFTDWTFCKVDEVTLKTMIRSSPGVILLKEGTVLLKLHHHSLKIQKVKKI